MEAGDVVAVAVDLIGLDQVREHEPALERAHQLGRLRQRSGVGRPRVLHVDPDPGEQLADLAHRVHLDPGRPELLQVAARRGREREVTPPVGTGEGARRAGERPRDHPSDRVLANQPAPDLRAHAVELGRADQIDVGGDLEHRVLARVDDQPTGLEVGGAEALDRLDPVTGCVAQDLAPAGGGDPSRAPRAGSRPDSAAAAATGRRPSAPNGRPSSPCRSRGRAAGHGGPGNQPVATPSSVAIEPRPSAPSVGSVETAGGLRQVPERVRAGVAVVGGVRQGADAARVEHDDEGPPSQPRSHRAILARSLGSADLRPGVRLEVHVAQPLGCQMRVDLGRADVGVAEHLLQRA